MRYRNSVFYLFFLLFLFFPFFLEAGTRVADFYYKVDKTSAKTIPSFSSNFFYPKNYHYETLLNKEQVELLYPQEKKNNFSLQAALTEVNEIVLGSEERLLVFQKSEILENFFYSESWGEENDNLSIIDNDSEESSLVEKQINKVQQKQANHPLAPYNDVPIEINAKRVDAFIHFYTHKKRKAFSTGLKRAPRYYKMVKRIFNEYGLPHDLFYLAMVESNFNYKAVSKARAVGVWQFIASTGKVYGMNYSWWHDDRLDPELATHAAAKFLKALYKTYGDWALVLAAYNSGQGNVNKAIKRNRRLGKPTDYWSLKTT